MTPTKLYFMVILEISGAKKFRKDFCGMIINETFN